jgi:ribosomal protein S18 acetylase RimI-like enzyme
VEIREIQAHEIEQARQPLIAHGWAHRVGDACQFRRLLDNSQRIAVAVVEDQIVGFARALCDGVSNGYLSMLIVAPEHRRRGVGRSLVQHIIGSDPHITWVVRADREGAAAFFANLGFGMSSVAMERTRATRSSPSSCAPGRNLAAAEADRPQ